MKNSRRTNKLIVSKYMELTESEAKNFWSVYEDYQKDLLKFFERLGALLKSYAADYRSKSLTDEKANKLLNEWIALEQDLKQRSAFIPRNRRSSVYCLCHPRVASAPAVSMSWTAII